MKAGDSNGKAEFDRSRKALQYASSIDDYVSIMEEGNNGGYANDWLIGDRNTGEIAYLELGLKNTPLWRSKDGYFVSSNFPRDPKLIKEETPAFDVKDMSSSPNARKRRWEELMKQDKGGIDATKAEQYLADHKDSYTGKETADARSLCGHVDVRRKRRTPVGLDAVRSRRRRPRGKVTTSDMAEKMTMLVHAGHPCGEDFSRQAISRGASAVCLGEADSARHEVRGVDGVQSRPDRPDKLFFNAMTYVLTLRLDESSQAFFEKMRQAHFPPERNQIPAHLTLFHQLPETRDVLASIETVADDQPVFSLDVTGLRSLGRGGRIHAHVERPDRSAPSSCFVAGGVLDTAGQAALQPPCGHTEQGDRRSGACPAGQPATAVQSPDRAGPSASIFGCILEAHGGMSGSSTSRTISERHESVSNGYQYTPRKERWICMGVTYMTD